MSYPPQYHARIRRRLVAHRARTDRLFERILAFQYIVTVAFASWLTPLTWIGSRGEVHLHVWFAAIVGFLIAAVPIVFIRRHPGQALTRHSVAIAQALAGALLIHIMGGRIEAHFHVFGSLAILAFYRDWRVLITATTVVAVDHALRGTWWPESVFGVVVSHPWRWAEHALWVLFQVAFLARSCLTSEREIAEAVGRETRLEETRDIIEERVRERTARLTEANERLEFEMERKLRAERERDELDRQLAQAQQLAAIGPLAASIAPPTTIAATTRVSVSLAARSKPRTFTAVTKKSPRPATRQVLFPKRKPMATRTAA